MELESLVNQHHSKLNENELAILSYILENKQRCQNIGIVVLSKECHTSKSSISRLMQKLGFSGFSEFKYLLKQSQAETVTEQKDLWALQQEDIDATLKLIQHTDRSEIIQKMYVAERIFCYGTGWGQQNAVKELTRNFMACGKYMLSIPAKTEFDLNVPIITEKDVVIIISFSGDVPDIKQSIQMLKLRNVPILSITAFTKNDLASLVPYNLYYQASPIHTTERNEIYSFVTLNLVGDLLFREYIAYHNEQM